VRWLEGEEKKKKEMTHDINCIRVRSSGRGEGIRKRGEEEKRKKTSRPNSASSTSSGRLRRSGEKGKRGEEGKGGGGRKIPILHRAPVRRKDPDAPTKGKREKRKKEKKGRSLFLVIKLCRYDSERVKERVKKRKEKKKKSEFQPTDNFFSQPAIRRGEERRKEKEKNARKSPVYISVWAQSRGKEKEEKGGPLLGSKGSRKKKGVINKSPRLRTFPPEKKKKGGGEKRK